MAHTLLNSHNPLNSSDPGAALLLSQQAPSFLSQSASQPGLPSLLASSHEKPEQWATYEQVLFACLRTGDDKSAHLCLDQLTQRFGASNERVMGLRGMYQEAIAEDTATLENILLEYEKILSENPVNVPILKRRVAILRSMSRHADAISALVEFLEAFPTDAEAWCELADLYQSQGMGSQAIFCLEEALLIAPNSWNLNARLGELQYISAVSSPSEPQETQRLLASSVRRFCRSVELCDDYLRGFYGLILASSRLLGSLSPTKSSANGSGKSGDELPPTEILERLNNLATRKLEDILKSRSSNIRKWQESQGELIAAQELLDRRDDL
ncbi:hypothetical protein VTN00DRAFT_5947 [Thermoascus crustaceus]|uniref:uncharacterized protein n=1 Tax=Thermoascus crustaceus TaxID=5088 RepID=UPI003741FE5D